MGLSPAAQISSSTVGSGLQYSKHESRVSPTLIKHPELFAL